MKPTDKFHIFLDLDETLCHNFYKPKKKATKIVLPDGDTYHGFKRPIAHQILAECRVLAPTFMLTIATRDYALAVNKAYDFNFKPEEILAREDCWDYILMAYGYDYLNIYSDLAPNSVLVDNNWVGDEWAKRKMQVLGIKPENYFQIPTFDGNDPDEIADEWGIIYDQILKLAN